MAEWFVGPIMEKLIDTCSEYLKDQFIWQIGMKEELERLRENHPKIQAVVSAASQTQMMIDPDSPLNTWIWQLRDVIDEAEDVLDDFEYMKHEEQLARNMEETRKRSICSFPSGIAKKFLRVGESALKIGKRAFKSDPMLKRLEEVVQKLDRISLEISNFLYLIENTKMEQQVLQQIYRETESMPKSVLIGRGQDKEYIIQWLGKLPNEEHQSHVSNIPNYNNISVLSIVGPGGMGKTTLLQHVYEGISTNDFDLKIWACVSDNFNVKKVFADMLESLKKTRPSLESLDALQNSLKLEVMSKKFLLVLDDIWEEDEVRDKTKWENVLAPLAYGGLGSKILITTRMKSVALMIAEVINKEVESLMIKGLDDDKCLHLLNTHAFAGVENPNDYKKLRSITEELVKKLFGSPLAAKVLGSALNSNLDERYWIKLLNNALGEVDISSILKLSYTFLPKYLQICFAFCSIFQQDHVFDKDVLVRMWSAVGLIQPSSIQGDTLEDIGGKYFDILVNKSFFDKVEKGYMMHDLIHELAQFVSTQECFRVVGDEDSKLEFPKTIRYLSIETGNIKLLEKIGKFKNLRALCITYVEDNKNFGDVLTQIFEVTRGIRLLSIHAYYQKKIPDKIECLKHLRYLKLDFPIDSSLQSSVSNLYHLQFLICSYDVTRDLPDDFFPRDMNNLSNLYYLKPPHFKFPGIGKLKFLQEVNGFVVKNETGYRVEELKYMNDLCILGIKGLENVRDSEEACSAKLGDKRKLTELSLEWEEISQSMADLDIYERVLDNLQPHNNLKKLTMKEYMGVRSAIWMNNDDLIKNLEHIELFGCLEWQSLPPFGQLPFLKSLKLREMPKVKRLDNKFRNDMSCGFTSLEVLSIVNLEALEDWFDAGVNCLFPCLTELELYNCPKMQELPYLPPKLEKLKADKIGWKTLNCCSISESIPLEELQVLRCPNITYIIGGLAVIRKVEIVDCPNVISLGGHEEVETTESIPSSVERLQLSYSESLQCLPSSLSTMSFLNELKLISIPFLKSLPHLPPSLRTIHLERLDNLECLPSCFPSLSSLTSLSIWRAPQLRELPDLPPSLCRLLLDNLDNLNCLPSCLPSLSSLTQVDIDRVPQLRQLPHLPPSLCKLKLINLDNLNYLPNCLSSLSSLTFLSIFGVPHLQELPDLPPSLCRLSLENLPELNCLPSCLSSLSSLTYLSIRNVPLLRYLPGRPPSLENLKISKCDPELMKSYEEY